MSQLIHIEEIIPSKSNIQAVANALTANVEAGSISAAEFAVKVKFLQEVLTKALKDTNYALCREVGEAKDFICLGAKIEPTEVKPTYSYEQDDKWKEIQAQIEPLEQKRKAQEELVKIATKKGITLVNEDTGEILAQPVTKTSTSSVKITLSK